MAELTATAAPGPALDVATLRQGLPAARPRGPRPAHHLPRLGGVVPAARPRCSTPCASYDETTHANVHRGVYAIAEEATRRFEAARVNVGPVHRRTRTRPRGGLHQERHRGAQPGRPLLGPHPPAAGATSSCSPRWSTTPTSCPGTCWPPSGASSCGGCPIDDDGQLVLDDLDAVLDGAKLLGVTCMSNVLGTLNPVAELADAAHAAGAVVVADACQSVPHLPTDVAALGVDFLAFSAHKMLGPDRHRRAVGPRGAAGRAAPVPRRRRDDPRRPQGRLHPQRHPVAVRGRHAADHRGHRPGCRRRLPAGRRAWTPCGPTRWR